MGEGTAAGDTQGAPGPRARAGGTRAGRDLAGVPTLRLAPPGGRVGPAGGVAGRSPVQAVCPLGLRTSPSSATRSTHSLGTQTTATAHLRLRLQPGCPWAGSHAHQGDGTVPTRIQPISRRAQPRAGGSQDPRAVLTDTKASATICAPGWGHSSVPAPGDGCSLHIGPSLPPAGDICLPNRSLRKEGSLLRGARLHLLAHARTPLQHDAEKSV